MTDEKKWHDYFEKIVNSLDFVSKPRSGEWGNILSVPKLHVNAYRKMSDIFPDLLANTEEGSELYETIEFIMKSLLPSYAKQVEVLVRKYENELNKADSEGFKKIQNVHADFRKRVIDVLSKARYG